MKRLCVFAHYDKDNIIDDYVIYYLKALKEVCSTIIFVSDACGLDTSDIKGIADVCIVEKHGEYDFGSYKRGFLFAKNNNIEFDELLFVNDSCYGPFYPLNPILEKMEKKKCDFWGMTLNNYGYYLDKDKNIINTIVPHLQSYFLVFYPKVFNSKVFNDFINSIQREETKDDVIIKYEINLTVILKKNGFKYNVFINSYSHTENCLASKWDRLIKFKRFPLLKTAIPKRGLFLEGEVKNWGKVISYVSDYPVGYIKKNVLRLADFEENLYSKMNLYRKIRYKILKNSPVELRYFVITAEKNLFLFFNTLCFNKLKKF